MFSANNYQGDVARQEERSERGEEREKGIKRAWDKERNERGSTTMTTTTIGNFFGHRSSLRDALRLVVRTGWARNTARRLARSECEKISRRGAQCLSSGMIYSNDARSSQSSFPSPMRRCVRWFSKSVDMFIKTFRRTHVLKRILEECSQLPIT